MLAYDRIRAQSPDKAIQVQIDQKYGGKPKEGQLVREGHYPKFSELIDQIEDIALEYVGFENFLDITKTQCLKDRKDLSDILTGKKSAAEIENNQESMAILPQLTNSAKPKPVTSTLNYASCDSAEGTNAEEKDMTKVPMRRYDHDANQTYHMGLYKAVKWDKKIAPKYFSPSHGSSRKAPFTLKQIRGRDQEKRLAQVRVENQLKVGNQSIDKMSYD